MPTLKAKGIFWREDRKCPPSAKVGLTGLPAPGIHSQTGRWIGEGWRLVQADLGTFFLMALVFSLLNAAVPVLLQGPLLAFSISSA